MAYPETRIPNQTETPQIFRASDNLILPPWLTKVKDGPRTRLIVDASHAKNARTDGRYDTVIDFGDSMSQIRVPVPQAERLTTNSDNLTVLAFEDPAIRQAIEAITTLVNTDGRSSEFPEDRREYRQHLESVYAAMAKKTIEWAGGNKVLIYPPLNGGRFVKEVFAKAGFAPGSRFLNYRMSRIRTNDGGLMVAITLAENNPDITDFKCHALADDCLASKISTFGTQLQIEDAFQAKNLSLANARLFVTFSVASQRGVESILSPEGIKRFGFATTTAVVGDLSYSLTDNYYLLAADGKKPMVEDMGNWTQPIPA
jgi:hypothetical protein